MSRHAFHRRQHFRRTNASLADLLRDHPHPQRFPIRIGSRVRLLVPWSHLRPRAVWNLLQQLPHRRIQLHIVLRVAFSHRPLHQKIYRPRMQFHRRSIRRRNPDKWQPQKRAINQLRSRSVNNPARRRFADHFSQLHGAISFREIFRVGKRMLIRHQNRRKLQRALPQFRARRRRRKIPWRHRQIRSSRQNVERIRIHKYARVFSTHWWYSNSFSCEVATGCTITVRASAPSAEDAIVNATRLPILCSSNASKFVCAPIASPSTAVKYSPVLIPPASSAGPSGRIFVTRKCPELSASPRSKSKPIRPSVGCVLSGPEIPRCDPFSSPSISEISRRTSSGFAAASTRGSYSLRTSFQFAPL